MSSNIQSIRGMHDFAPGPTELLRLMERKLITILEQYGYQEIRTPVVEKLELFKRSIGEVTDIVEKEMYAFEDRGGDYLALRPEGTASTVRAGIQNGWLHNQQQRLWYMGPFFRRERPQKGRYRQFHQLGVETFGFGGPDMDAELILLSRSIWRVLGLPLEQLELQINTLGDPAARAEHRSKLIEYLSDHHDRLDEDARGRLQTNPLRILDSKNPEVQAVVKSAPLLMDYLDQEALEHFEQLKTQLTALSIPFHVNPTLVRGLDYYNRTVFEWVSNSLGAQGTVCAGGRYDGLVEQLGARATPAAGFAIGIERLFSLVEDQMADQAPKLSAYLVAVGEGSTAAAFALAERIRQQQPTFTVQMNCGGGSIKSQMKRADRSGAQVALILGESELESGLVTVKFLQQDQPQQQLSLDQLVMQITENSLGV